MRIRIKNRYLLFGLSVAALVALTVGSESHGLYYMNGCDCLMALTHMDVHFENKVTKSDAISVVINPKKSGGESASGVILKDNWSGFYLDPGTYTWTAFYFDIKTVKQGIAIKSGEVSADATITITD